MTKLIELPNYVKAARESLKPRSHSLYHDCLNAELHDIVGKVVYFRNYEDLEAEYIEFCFTREGVGKVTYNYTAYRMYEED